MAEALFQVNSDSFPDLKSDNLDFDTEDFDFTGFSSNWARELMPSDDFFQTYDPKHHQEKRFTDALRYIIVFNVNVIQ